MIPRVLAVLTPQVVVDLSQSVAVFRLLEPRILWRHGVSNNAVLIYPKTDESSVNTQNESDTLFRCGGARCQCSPSPDLIDDNQARIPQSRIRALTQDQRRLCGGSQ